MPHALRLTLLRLAAMTGLTVSALLTYDKLHPERAFCPLAQACQLAGQSALGEIAGVPTSVVGLVAFGAFFLLTLLQAGWARRLLRPAGLLAAIGGAVFFGYQALALENFCPLCLVADGAGFLCGILTLGWSKLAKKPTRKTGEGVAARVAWILAALLAVVLPYAWPREPHASYVEIAPAPDVFDDEPADPLEGGPSPRGSADAPDPAGPVKPSPTPPSKVPGVTPPPPSRIPPGSRQGIPPLPSTTTPPAAPRLPGSAAPTNAVPPARPAPSTPVRPPAPAPKVEVTVVEYLNAYCPHCRATHARLEKVLAESGVPVRRRRIYTWATNDYPAWARACALAQSVGLEERMFEELLRSAGPDLREVQAAAQRAGLDPQALAQALRDPNPPPRLVKDRQLFLQAGLKGLPTLDIGRRRLMGEQSEAELRSAIDAARPVAPPAPAAMR